MATPKSLGNGTIKYDAKDAAALMPLLVGFKPPGRNNDLGIIEPLCTYRPPKADVLRQSWKIHNTEALDAVTAAMKKCGTNCLFALNFDNKTFLQPPVTVKNSGSDQPAAETKYKNNYISVLGRIKRIEECIKTLLNTEEKRSTIASNAAELRLGTIRALQAKLKMADKDAVKYTMSEFMLNNSVATEEHLRKIFDIPNPNSRPWSGVGVFDQFWTSIIEPATGDEDATEKAYKVLAVEQEKNEIQSFTRIIDLHNSVYDLFISNISKETQSAIEDKYLYLLYEGSVPANTKIISDKQRAANLFDKYLWNVILERFEILDSTLSTFFSLICATRNIHVPLVKKLMHNAIFYCCYPLFSCVTKPASPAGASQNEKDIKDILVVLSEHSQTFKVFLEQIFKIDSGIPSKINTLTGPEKNFLQNHIFERLLHLSGNKTVMLGPRVESKERTPV